MSGQYTHGHHASVLRSHASRTVADSAAYLVERLRPGLDVVDVGCGPGSLTVDLASRVEPGRVVGIDAAAEVVEVARATAAEARAENVVFAVGDVFRLPARDTSFDVVHAHQLLQHVVDPVGALREMRRVCRRNGVVAMRDSDYAAMTWYPMLPALDRWLELYHKVTRSNGAEADAGRRLLGWARAAGFSDVSCSASVWCYATPEERSWWGGLWAERVVESRFAEQALARGFASARELQAIAAAFTQWSESDDAWFAVMHGEVVATP